jgi:dinuclear metal center YbgI/SA1388 family protein
MPVLESIVQYLDDLLQIPDHPDYSGAHNGLQVEGPDTVARVATAVDASSETIHGAVDGGGDLLLVHHGLFWGPTAPLTGPYFRRVAALISGQLGLYSAHLPLDSHPEVGNCALLGEALGWTDRRRFGSYEGTPLGWRGRIEATPVDDFVTLVSDEVGRPVELLGRGPDTVTSVAVVTGAGGGFIETAAAEGVEVLVTGEVRHHAAVEARERGVHVVCAGHYETETYGVRALGARLARRFGVETFFVDVPSGR